MISWTAPADGSSPLTDFVVFSDQASGSFIDLSPTTGSGSTTTYSITSALHSIVAGSTYSLKVVARNAVGDS